MFDEESLSPDERELETALRSLRPAAARIDVAGPVTRSGRGDRRRRSWPIAAAAAAVLLGLGAWLVVRPSGEKWGGAEHEVAVNSGQDAVAAEIWVEPPTVLVYRRALVRSPAELDALLDRQARSGNASQNAGVTLTAWKADLHSSLGEL